MRFDIEAVRVRLERELTPRKREPSDETLESTRRRAQHGGMRLTERMAPRLHAAMRTVLERLGVERDYELYSGRGHGSANAALLWSDPLVVLVIDGLGNLEEPAELQAVFAHEVGHALAGYRPQRGHEIYGLAAELTADRVGLLGCGSLEAALRLEMRSAAGGWLTRLQWAEQDYLVDAYTVVEQRLAHAIEPRGTHPEHYLRAWALAEFAKTATYRAHLGEEGGTSLETLEDKIDQLLRLKRHDPPTKATHGDARMKPERLAPPTHTTLEGVAFELLVDYAGRKLRAGGAGTLAVLTALGPPFRRLGAQALKRGRGKR